MKGWLILGVLVIGITAAATVAVQLLPADPVITPVSSRTPEETGPAPRLVVNDDLVYEFGRLALGDAGSKEWVIRNEGEGELRLTLNTKSCTCTSVAFNGEDLPLDLGASPTKTLAPGEEATVLMTWDTQPGDEQNERFSTEAVFVTNDFDNYRTLQLVARGQIVPPIITIPEYVDFPNASSEQETETMLVVFSPTHPDFQIEQTTTARPQYFDVKIEPLPSDELEGSDIEGGHMLTIILKPGMPIGDFRDSLVLKTDHPTQPEHTLSIRGKVQGPITAQPPSLFLYNISSKAGGSTDTTLTVRGQEETHFAVELPPRLQEILEVQVEPINRGASEAKARQYRLTVTIPPGTAPGQHGGEIVLKTDHPQAEEIKIRVSVRIQAG